ncbi:hypothetical protein AN958_04666 [Leucoagaricus sp. SymC.cos]|nr:hypothetical protein AN958_04666 [Leucoagaricus sp. SymC.cos]
MGSKDKDSSDQQIPNPPLKEQDFAPQPPERAATPPLAQTQQYDSDITATNSSDEFGWDENDEAKEDVGDFVKAKRVRWLWLSFMKFSRFTRVLLVGLFGAAILITPLLVVNLRFRNNPVRLQVHVWSLWLTIIWSAACMTTLVVNAIPHIVLLVTRLFGGQVERLKSQVELTMAVTGWIGLVLDVAWAWISLSVLRTVYHPPGSYWVIINRVMQAMFAAAMILFAEKFFLHFVAINFHEKALADRLAENRLGLKALDRLSNASVTPARKPANARRGHKSPGSSASYDVLTTSNRTQNESGEGSPITPEKKSSPSSPKMRIRVRHSDRQKKRAMASVIVDQVGEAIGQFTFKNSRQNQGRAGGLTSARRLALKLFSTLNDTYPPRAHLTVEDFEPYFRTTAEAVSLFSLRNAHIVLTFYQHAAFAIFDKDGNGDITRREMREAVQRIYRERKALTASLKDVSSIVAKLDAVLISVALVVIIFVCLLIFNKSNTLASLVPLATIILGFSFIFGNSAQKLFESVLTEDVPYKLIFIFSTHVFDVGDLVMIDDQVLFVKEFGLFSTIFRRVDGQEIIAPNALLASAKLVHNLRRSKSMWESTTLTVSYNTPIEVIEQLRLKIGSYIAANNREWSDFGLNIDKMEYQNALHLIVAIEHRPNWQDWGGRWARRTAFMRHLKNILEELDINYIMPVQPILLPTSGPPPMSMSQVQAPSSGSFSGPNPDLGNAGGFRPTDIGLVPGRSYRAAMQQTNTSPKTLSSVLEDIQANNDVPPHKNHPFASGSEDSYAYLQQISQAADQITNSLNSYLSFPWAQPKLTSLLRQQSNLTSTIRISERRTKEFVDAFQNRAGTIYSEDIPLDPASVASFCISRLEAWGVKAGMESFKDDGRGGNVTVMLGGKVLVVDVDFSISKENLSRPRARVANVKTSYATSDDASGNSSNTKGSISLDAFLAESVQKYCDEVQRPEEERDAIRAARLAMNVQKQLHYLVMLDRLAEKKDGARAAWFVDTDELCPKVEAFAKSEAEVVASALSIPAAPLDIFLLRSHALPLPYLSSPSITFLVYTTPLAYLSFLRSIINPPTKQPNLPFIDIPLTHLRSQLSEMSKGVTTATLSVVPLTSPPLFTSAELLPGIASRPTFTFSPHGADIRHVFPRSGTPMDATVDTTHHVWMLDFTNGGKWPGVVMSQSQLRDIEMLITPLGGIHADLEDINIISFNANSWVDLLLNPANGTRHERYTTLYTSPGGLHPPLQLRLTPPDEPGFILERVPVHNIQEVWGILEIVREQSWLNESLLACQWVPEELKLDDTLGIEELEVTEDELQAVLAGTNIPQKIPVNVTLNPTNETDNLFGPPELDAIPRRPKIVMRCPERPPITGLVEISVSLNETRPRGIAVEVQGAMGLDMSVDVLEEICRRGGTLGVLGRIWANSQGPSL